MPEWLIPSSPTGFHALNPLTKLILATATAIDAVLVGGIVGPLAMIVALVLLPAVLARVATQVCRLSMLLSLPLAISTLLVNVFFFPSGQDVLFRVGPMTATREGLLFATEMLLQIVAISGAIILFYLTTRPADLVLDLERRGASRRLGFVINASMQVIPIIADRAATVTAAQRARGLDTQGSIRKRLRGVLPIVGPVVLGAIEEVEERTLALEARAFAGPGPRTLLWSPTNSTVQRLARWALVLTIPLIAAARITGIPAGPS